MSRYLIKKDNHTSVREGRLKISLMISGRKVVFVVIFAQRKISVFTVYTNLDLVVYKTQNKLDCFDLCPAI